MSNEYALSRRQESRHGIAEYTMPSRALTREEIEDEERSQWYRIELTGQLNIMPIQICSHTFLTTLVLKNNYFEFLPIEICNLVNLRNLDASNNLLKCLPHQMGFMDNLRSLLLSNNYITEVPHTFSLLIGLKMLDLTGNPLIGTTVENYTHTDKGQQLIRFLVGQHYAIRAASIPPPERTWHILEEQSGGTTFTIMSYNILCNTYATPEMYNYCPEWALKWEYRKQGLLEEILKYNADIICLQELATSQFEEVFSVVLKKRNYDGVFVPKSRSRTMHQSDSKAVDGCAIFWKTDRFEKVHHFTHEFMLSCSNISKNPTPELVNRVMSRDNVALSIILQVKDSKMERRRICVSNGHIHWDPQYSDVKVVQTLFWTSELWNYIREFYSKENIVLRSPNEMPVILCGDFNSLPESAVIDYLVKGEVERSHVDFKDFGDKYLFEEWSQIQHEFLENDSIKHRFHFDRAYKECDDDGMRYTNYTYDFRGVIDYIFFSKDRLSLLSHLKQVPDQWFITNRIRGAPHVNFNSDHFPLMVKLELKSSVASPSVASTSTSNDPSGKMNISMNIEQQRKNCAALTGAATSSTIYPHRGQSTC